MRLAGVVLLLMATALAGCGGDRPVAPARAPSVAAYAASTNRLCAELIGALRRAFDEAAGDPDGAMAHYAVDVNDAGRRFAAVTPPRSLARFAAAAVRHVEREAGVLRRAARRSAAGDPAAAARALGRHGALLPERIPATVLRRAPACGGVAPAAPPSPGGTVVAISRLAG
ncbi:MAG: hypothetical protein QOE31_3718 [Solirubrobacteraceae bacterium]|nr:hypothetical protein [Solirubrobacteraceae bacterium]